MHCQNCGAPLAGSATYCTACGTAVPGAGIPVGAGPLPAQPPGSYPPPAERGAESAASWPAPGAAAGAAVRYAGFWLRLVAFLIDMVALFIAGLFLDPILEMLGVPMRPFAGEVTTLEDLLRRPDLIERLLPAALVNEIIRWLYHALLESSPWQATLGKKALGLAVTDLEGRRISFLRATGRHWAKLLSQFTLLIGYLMAGFTKKKQALHDIIADCLVIRR